MNELVQYGSNPGKGPGTEEAAARGGFSFKVPDGRALLRTLRAIANVTEEGVLQVRPSGVVVREMDQSHITMIEWFLRSDLPLDIRTNGEQLVKVNFRSLVERLEKINSELPIGDRDAIEFSCDGRGRSMTVSVLYSWSSPRSFMIRRSKPIGNVIPTVQLNFDVMVSVSPEELYEFIRGLKCVDWIVRLEATKYQLKVAALGEMRRGEFVIRLLEDVMTFADGVESVVSHYRNESLELFLRNVRKGFSGLRVWFSKDKPLMMETFSYAGALRYYVAPIIV